ncbi:hypothetical protein WME98_45640 [Sorangium sp. So ce296]|uniref:hypothetical protein n=1 Tax=Sorangium sp. So ce296 TaxID=3133296 RepID=UPI003F61F428
MGTSPKPTTWIVSGSIAAAALVAYNLGRTSTESDNQPQSHQDAASKDNPDLRSSLSAAQKRLANCEKSLQRRDHHPLMGEKKPLTSEDIPIPPPERELSKQCIAAMQAKELTMAGANCKNFRGHFDAYKMILGSSTLDCETVLSIRGLARTQYNICTLIIQVNKEIDKQGAAIDPVAADAVQDAYAIKGEHGDVNDIDALVKNPACIARMQTE